MITENSVTYQLIANANAAAAVASGSLEDLPEGGVVIVGTTGAVLPNAPIAPGTRVRVAQRVNGQLVFSPYFTTGGPTTVATQTSIPAVEQVSYLGYNEVTTVGQLDVEDGRDYLLSLHLYHTQGVYNNTPMIKSIPAWVAPQPAGTTAGQIQFLLATALLTSLNRQFRRSPSQVVLGERVTSNAGVILDADVGSTDALGVTNGSEIVTLVEVGVGPGTLGAGTNVVAGGFITILGVAYRIEAVGVNSITLDSPYTGATAEIPVALGDTNIIAAIQAGDNWGLRLTGVTSVFRNPVTETPAQVNFKITFDKVMNAADNGIQPVVLTTSVEQVGAFNGIGTGPQVAVKEVYTTMNEGQPQICSYPPTNYRRAAILNAAYHLKVINAIDQEYITATTGQRPVSKYNVIIAVNTALNATTWAVIDAQIP